MDPFLDDDGEDWDDTPAHDGNLWRKLDTPATSRSWVDPAVVTLEIDDSSITKLDGDLVAIHRLLDEHYAGFGNLCEPFMGVVNGTRVVTYDLLGYTTRETALALTYACRKNGLDACNLLFDKLLAHSLHKPTFAALLLAQAIATTFPETVAFSTVMAVQSLVTTETESSLITTMWYLSQAASSSTPISVYAWVQFMLPVSVDTSAPLAARQWALACLQQLATLPVIPGGDTGAQISFDLLIVLDCCCYAEKQVGEILTENYPFLKSVWLAQASDSDLQGLFYRVLMELESVPQDNSDPRTLELVAIGVGLLSRLDWLYENWRQKVRQRHSKRREFVPLIKGSQHFLQYVLELGYDKKLHKSQLSETLHQMILLCDQFVERSNRLGAALEDAVKVKLALRYFKDLLRMLQPSHASWWLQGAVLVTLLAALIHRLCVHCMACPCGPNRACSNLHPCLLLERTGLAGAIVGGTATVGEYAWQPLLPYKETVVETLATVAGPMGPYVAQAGNMTVDVWTKHGVPMLADFQAELWPLGLQWWEWFHDQGLPALRVGGHRAYQQSRVAWHHFSQRIGEPALKKAKSFLIWARATIQPHLTKARATIANGVQEFWREAKGLAVKCGHTTMHTVQYIVLQLWPWAVDWGENSWWSSLVWLRYQSEKTMQKVDTLLVDTVQWVRSNVLVPAYDWLAATGLPAVRENGEWAWKEVCIFANLCWEALQIDETYEWLQAQAEISTVAETIVFVFWAVGQTTDLLHWAWTDLIGPAIGLLATTMWSVMVFLVDGEGDGTHFKP